MKESEDAYGALLLAHLADDTRACEIVERDDGFIETNAGPGVYFKPFRRWAAHERRAMRFVRGRVLDVGAGAGRVSLHLQERGHEVVAIDISPGAVEVCRRRGVRDARLCRFEDVGPELGVFDTVVMWGNNFGLFGGPATSGNDAAPAPPPHLGARADRRREPRHVCDRRPLAPRLPRAQPAARTHGRPAPAPRAPSRQDHAVVRLPDRLPGRAARPGRRHGLAGRPTDRGRGGPVRHVLEKT